MPERREYIGTKNKKVHGRSKPHEVTMCLAIAERDQGRNSHSTIPDQGYFGVRTKLTIFILIENHVITSVQVKVNSFRPDTSGLLQLSATCVFMLRFYGAKYPLINQRMDGV